MANKVKIPAQSGSGSATHPTKTVSIPFYRLAKVRAGGAGNSNLQPPVVGQVWPRRS